MEGGRRISASPRPCSSRRVVAAMKRQRIGGVDGFLNSVTKLQQREIISKRVRGFAMSDAQERFRNIRLQEECDTHDPKGIVPWLCLFCGRRPRLLKS